MPEFNNKIVSTSQFKLYKIVASLSMGLLVNADKAIIWRGPLVMSALQRLIRGAIWGPLDILLVDTPPGTGDIHLSLSQNVPIAGALLISTPQTAALDVTRRGAEMYNTLKIPLIGLVENMSHIECDNCGHKIEVYEQKTKKLLSEMNISILESIPIVPAVVKGGDAGIPVTVNEPQSQVSQLFNSLAKKVVDFLPNKTN